MTNLKPFDPNEVDETLTRVVIHRGVTHLLFPYVDALASAPKFESIHCVIDGPAATVEDFTALSALIQQGRQQGEWFISFNTPWLMTAEDAGKITRRASAVRPQR